MDGDLWPDIGWRASGHVDQRVRSPRVTVQWGGNDSISFGSLYKRVNRPWLFLLRIHPSEPSHSSLTHLDWLIHHLVRLENIQVHCFECASRGTWWLCFAAEFACYSWSLPTPRWLGATRIVERRKVLVSDSNRGDCEGFLSLSHGRSRKTSLVDCS
jgi:hypothetical protein